MPKVQLKRIDRRSFLSFFFLLFFVFNGLSIAQKLDAYDSLYINTLNTSEEELKEIHGIQDSILTDTLSLQEKNEYNPAYTKREYNHKEQVIVGSVVMLCVALAMVLMNNYNPKR